MSYATKPLPDLRECARVATADDVNAVMELRSESEKWMAMAGIRQWVPMHAETSRELMRSTIADGQTWLFEIDGVAAATVTLKDIDPDYWTPEECAESSLGVFKMITARRFAGRDLGGRVLDWCTDVARDQGKQWVRLDCRRDNTALHDYYRRQGFELVRIETRPRFSTHTRFSGALFQRPVT